MVFFVQDTYIDRIYNIYQEHVILTKDEGGDSFLVRETNAENA